MTKKFKPGIFDLDADQLASTKMFYNGKVIKCLVAPYHTTQYFEENLDYANNVFVFPEALMPQNQLPQIIGMIVSNPKFEEAIIITSDILLITQMIGDNVRVFTEAGNIVPCPIKCLMANIYDVKINLLEAPQFKDGGDAINLSNYSKEMVTLLIAKIHDNTDHSDAQYDLMKSKIDMVGEVVIRVALQNTLDTSFGR